MHVQQMMLLCTCPARHTPCLLHCCIPHNQQRQQHNMPVNTAARASPVMMSSCAGFCAMRMHGTPLQLSSSCCPSELPVLLVSMFLSASSTSKLLPLLRRASASAVELHGVTCQLAGSAVAVSTDS
jgi:hypothetical protein